MREWTLHLVLRLRGGAEHDYNLEDKISKNKIPGHRKNIYTIKISDLIADLTEKYKISSKFIKMYDKQSVLITPQ